MTCLSLAADFDSPGFVSGWYFFASLRKARFISAWDAVLSTFRMS